MTMTTVAQNARHIMSAPDQKAIFGQLLVGFGQASAVFRESLVGFGQALVVFGQVLVECRPR
jgi:hypothetical protein